MDIGSLTGSIELRDEISDTIERCNRLLGQLGQSVSVQTERFEKLGSSLLSVGKTMSLSVTAPIVAFGTAAVAAGLQMEGAYNTIARKTGETGTALGGLKKDFEAVFVTVPNSAQEVAAAIADVHQRLGLTGTELQGVTKKFLDFANVNQVDVAGATRTVIQMMGALSENTNMTATEIGNASSIMDKLTYASQLSGASVTQLAHGMTQGGRAMGLLGFSMNDSIALFAQFEKVGANVTDVTSSMDRVLTNLAKEGVTDLGAAFKGMVDEIKNAAGEAEAIDLARSLFGAKSGRKLAEEIRGGTYEIQGLSTELANLGNVTENTAKNSESFADTIETVKKQVTLLLAPIGVQLLGSFREMIPAISDTISVLAKATEWFAGLPKPVQTTTFAFLGLVAAVGPLLMAVGSIWTKLGVLIPSLGVTAAATTTLTGATVASTAATTASIGVFGFWNAALTGTTTSVFLARAAVGYYKVEILATNAVTVVSAAVQRAFGVALLATSLNANVLLASLAASRVGQIALAASTAISTTAMGASAIAAKGLGIALGLVQFVLLPLIAVWAGWKMGPMIGDWLGLSDAIERASLRLQRWLGLIPQATTDQDIFNAVAANTARRTGEMGQGFNAAADEAKRLRDHLSGAALANDVEKLRVGFASMTDEQRKSADVLKRVGEQAEMLRQQGGRLHPELAAAADAFVAMSRDGSSAAGSMRELERINKALADAMKPLTAEQQRQAIAMDAAGFSVDKIAEKMKGVSNEAVQLFIDGLKKSTETAKEFQKKLDEFSGKKAIEEAQEVVKMLASIGGASNLLPEKLGSVAKALQDGAVAAQKFKNEKLATELASVSVQLTASVQALQVRDLAALSSKGVTLEMIETNKRLGISEDVMVAMWGVKLPASLGLYGAKLSEVRQITDDLTKSRDALTASTHAQVVAELAINKAVSERKAVAEFEQGTTSAEERAAKLFNIQISYNEKRLAAEIQASNALEAIEQRDLQKRIDRGELVNASAIQLEEMRTNITQTYSNARVKVYQNETERVAAEYATVNTAIDASQKTLNDKMRQQTMTTVAYQISKIREGAELQISVLKGDEAQRTAHAAIIRVIANQEVSDLYVNKGVLKSQSKAALDYVRDVAWNTYKAMAAAPAEYSEATIKEFKRLAEAASRAAAGITETWQESAFKVATVFADMFEGINSKVGQMIHVFAEGFAAITKAGATTAEKVAAGFAMAAQALSTLLGEDGGGKVGGAAVGALSGAAAGAAFGPIGAGIGAAAGALLGWIGASKKAEEAAKKHAETLKEFKQQVIETYGSMETLTATAARFGVAINFSDNMTPKQFEEMNKQLEVMDTRMEQVTAATSKMVTGLNAVVKEMSRPWLKLGEDIDEAVKKTKKAQEALTAATGGKIFSASQFEDMSAKRRSLLEDDELTGGSTLREYDRQFEGIDVKKVHELTNAFNDASKAEQAFYSEKARMAAEAKQQLADLGTQAMATFAGVYAASGSYSEALAAVGPAVASLASAYEILGLEVEDVVFKALLIQSAVLEGSPDLLAAIDAQAGAMQGAAQMNLLNADTFAAMQRTGSALYLRLQGETVNAALAVGDLGDQTRNALMPMQGYLQQAAAQAFLLQIPLDDNTQSMINQSKELGIWKDKGKDANDLMIEGFGMVAQQLNALIVILGGTAISLEGMGRSGQAGLGGVTDSAGDAADAIAGGKDSIAAAAAAAALGISGEEDSIASAAAEAAEELKIQFAAAAKAGLIGDSTSLAWQSKLSSDELQAQIRRGVDDANHRIATIGSEVPTIPNIPVYLDVYTTYHDKHNITNYVTTIDVPQGEGDGDGIYPSTGGIVPAYYAVGGEASQADVAWNGMTPKGTDTVPAMLTPGERVLSVSQNEEYEDENGPKVLKTLVGMREDLRRNNDNLLIQLQSMLAQAGN